jgi:hypothetical protein
MPREDPVTMATEEGFMMGSWKVVGVSEFLCLSIHG